MMVTKFDEQNDRIPLVVRFAITCYEHAEGQQYVSDSRISFSPFGEHTNTYASTTDRGNDKDKTDQQRD